MIEISFYILLQSSCNKKEKLHENVFLTKDFNKYIFKNNMNFNIKMLGHDWTRKSEIDSSTCVWHL